MFRTFLSLRYLRSRKTSWIGIAGIFVAVAALVMILSIMAGFLAESRRSLRGNLADLVIQPGRSERVISAEGAYMERRTDVAELVGLVKEHPRVLGATPQLQWYGLFMPSGRERAFQRPLQDQIQLVEMVGVEVETEANASTFAESLVADYANKPEIGEDCTVGRVEDPSDPFARLPRRNRGRSRPPIPILVGEQLAYLWQLGRGEEVTLFSVTLDERGEPNEEPAKATFQVVGSFRTGDNEMDSRRIYLDRRDLADFLQLYDPSWSAVLVKLEDYERDKNDVRAELWSTLNEGAFLNPPGERLSEIRTWEDFRAQLLRAIQNEKMLMAIMLSLVLVVACFTVFALLSMMVTEKRRDIGILCALGATSRGVMALFLMIGMWEAVLGSAAGALVGVLGALNIDGIEVWLSETFGFEIFDRDVYLFDHIPSDRRPGSGAGLTPLEPQDIAYAVRFLVEQPARSNV
ncbi:MAG: FtsX-like permease family protein, partial [Planctomycetota bacterium]|nr:FtsX-like permease family protein [Planctomycetota bacterium]